AVLTQGLRARNQNMLYDAGVKVRSIPPKNDYPRSLWGDTLKAEVDLSGIRPGFYREEWSGLAKCAVQCVAANAAQSSHVRVIVVRVTGHSGAAALGGVFQASRYRQGPIRVVFDDF